MTIRRRLTLSFAAILALFAVNLLIYFWSNQVRQASVEALRRAISRQALLSSIGQILSDSQKQISLLSQVAIDLAASGAAPGQIAQFSSRLSQVRRDITALIELSEPEDRVTIEEFGKLFDELSRSWHVFYRSFGVDQSTAITELAVRGDPLSQKAIGEVLPRLQADENAHVEAASANFYRIARLTDRISIAIFVVSLLFAAGVAWSVSQRLTGGLGQLKAGASAIGAGKLDYRIALPARDELGQLGHAFNEMSEKLAAARTELTRANELEHQRSEQLAAALDQLHKAQDQLIVQQKLASLGSLTAAIAHEIKNPLNFVTNFAELSVELAAEIRGLFDAQKDRLEPKDVDYLNGLLADLEQNVSKIREHGKRADSIVRGMLMHSRGQTGEMQASDINSLLGEYVKLAYHGMRAQNSAFNVTIVEDYDPSIPPVVVAPQELSRAFLNITNNACYAVHEKAKRLGDSFRPEVRISTKDTGGAVEVRIRDNGDGVAADVRKKIFEPFFTTKPAGSGTGLGLSMSYEIVVQEHKGTLRLETVPGEFAEFIITIPK
jgi:signal transduction histidine kinase